MFYHASDFEDMWSSAAKNKNGSGERFPSLMLHIHQGIIPHRDLKDVSWCKSHDNPEKTVLISSFFAEAEISFKNYGLSLNHLCIVYQQKWVNK